jgi:peptidoglycan hydrolase CwlO-like protein
MLEEKEEKLEHLKQKNQMLETKLDVLKFRVKILLTKERTHLSTIRELEQNVVEFRDEIWALNGTIHDLKHNSSDAP